MLISSHTKLGFKYCWEALKGTIPLKSLQIHATYANRRMSRWFPHFKQFIEKNGNNNCCCTTTKNERLSISSCALERQLQLDHILLSAGASHSSRRAALRSLRFWGAEFQVSARRLSWSHRFSMGFRSGERAGQSIRGMPASNSRSLVMWPRWAGALSSMKMNLGLCCSCSGAQSLD